MFRNGVVEVEGVVVRSEILETPFVCDVVKCKGACCTLKSEYGAPVNNTEIEEIEKILDIVKEYLSEEHRSEIERNAFWEEKGDELLLRSVDKRACVFVYYENDIARCSLEKAFFEGKTNFRKPISCHLFPIRVTKFGGDILRYEKISECEPALENGKEKNITIAEFCRESLKRLYGKKWVSKLFNGTKE
jgi:Protein of unknown function (DUF3109)